MLQEGQAVEFAESVERMLQSSLGVPADAAVDDDPEDDPSEEPSDDPSEDIDAEPAAADRDEL